MWFEYLSLKLDLNEDLRPSAPVIPELVVFVKHYDIQTTEVLYRSPFSVKLTDKVLSVLPRMDDLPIMPPGWKITAIAYRMLKSGKLQKLDINKTFAQAKIKNLDLLCFQYEK
jgi:ICP0-binding domain of Ubiquitin-specific protease 7